MIYAYKNNTNNNGIITVNYFDVHYSNKLVKIST